MAESGTGCGTQTGVSKQRSATTPAADLLRKAAGVDRGSATTGREPAGTITRDQLREIATVKLADLNANDIEAAMRQVEGTARSMGIEVAG